MYGRGTRDATALAFAGRTPPHARVPRPASRYCCGGFFFLSTLLPITPPNTPPTTPPITAPLSLSRLVAAPSTAPAAAPIAASRLVCFTTVPPLDVVTVPPLVEETLPPELRVVVLRVVDRR